MERRARAARQRAGRRTGPGGTTASDSCRSSAGRLDRRPRATIRCSTATGARSPSSSAICAVSPLSPSPAEPEDVDDRPARPTTRALGELIFDFEGTLERFTGDGLMVFFNDPVPCPTTRPCAPCSMAVAMRDRVGELAADWQPTRSRPSASGSGSRRASRRSVVSASRGAADYAAIGTRHEPRGAPVRRRERRSGPGERTGAGRRSRMPSRRDPVDDLPLKGFSKPIRVFNVLGLQRRVCRRRAQLARRRPQPRRSGSSTRTQRSQRFAELQHRLPEIWGAHAHRSSRANRSSSCPRGTSTSRTSRQPSRRPTRSGCSSCCCCCASRGCGSST